MDKITTLEEFEAWLKRQPEQTHYAIRSRAALRVFPAVLAPLHDANIKFEAKGQFALLTARACLTSAVAATTPTAEVKVIAALSNLRSVARSPVNFALFSNTEAAAFLAAQHAHVSATDSTALSAVESSANSSASSSVRTPLSDTEAAALSPPYAAAYSDTVSEAVNLGLLPIWQGADIPLAITQQWQGFRDSPTGQSPTWSFWREWYQGFLDGTPMDWALQREVALIPNEDWDKGAAHIAGVIERIRADFNPKDEEKAKPPEPTTEEKQSISARVKYNSTALALSIAGVLEQISVFHETVRGNNKLDPDDRQGLLDFLGELSNQLGKLMGDLPQQGEEISDEKSNGFVLWWREYHHLITKKAYTYITPDNISEATVPSGIILGCMGVGALVSGPAGAGVGALVGGLITGQVKPGKAMDELIEPTDGPDLH